MKDLFYKNFNIAASPLVVFAGDRRDNALLNLAAEETVAAGQHVIIISGMQEKYPIEGKVLVSPDISMVINLIDAEELQVIYLARKIDDDILFPFSGKDLNQLVSEQSENVKIFYKIDASSVMPEIFQSANIICTLNFNVLREKILKIYSNDTFKSSETSRKKIRQHVISLITNNCQCINNPSQTGKKSIFIAQVKTLLDENLIIPVVRDLKSKIKSHIFYGSINHYQLKEV